MDNRSSTIEGNGRVLAGWRSLRQRVQNGLRHRRSLAEVILFVSLPAIFLLLVLVRPPTSFYALPLISIALAAMLYEFVGGMVAALTAMVGVAVIMALDPLALRRAITLQEVWPILLVYLAVGPLVGWLAARERERERRQAHMLAAIRDAGHEIAASLDMERTLALVMQKASVTLPMDAGALFLFDEAAQVYRVAVSHNLSPDRVAKIEFEFDQGVPGWVVQYRRPLIIHDVSNDNRVHPAVIAEDVKSLLAIPLVTREQLVGVLNLFCQTGTHAFDDEALRLAQVYADQVAVFIENAQLVEKLRLAAAELEARVERRTAQLRQTQAQVIRAEKMAAVGRLAGSVAHEVNNPLQAIALHLQLAAEGGVTETAVAQLHIVRQELDRIAKIAQRLLDFQRPKSGTRTRQDVTALVDDVLALAGEQLQQANVAVIWEKPIDLPPVTAVGDRLKQVFLNLILNAVEAMPEGGQLHIKAEQSAGTIALAFADNGTGMTEAVMSQLFEPFFSTRHSGSGLGLAVSHEIIAGHGGTLEASSQPGQGVTFTVRLPVHSASITQVKPMPDPKGFRNPWGL